MNISHITYTADDQEQELIIPAKYEVCPHCEGRGSHVNPSIDGHGISFDQFDEDPDFREAYFSGAFDVPCESCGGDRVVLVPDEERCDPEILKIYLEDKAQERIDARALENERRAECGYMY